MNIKLLNRIGILGGLAVIFLATAAFSRSYHEEQPKWNYLLMIFGMIIILFYTLFKKKKKR